jgi:hypothetical protein
MRQEARRDTNWDKHASGRVPATGRLPAKPLITKRNTKFSKMERLGSRSDNVLRELGKSSLTLFEKKLSHLVINYFGRL